MAKKKKPNNITEASKAAAKVRATELREMQRSGVVVKAATFTDRRREANRSACRGKGRTDYFDVR